MAYDYIIVGGGTAGCVLAARLSADPDKSVLLLEAGPEDRHPAIGVPGASAFTVAAPGINWHMMTEPQVELNNRALYLAQGKVIGGSSSINGMVYTRGAPGDYHDWVAKGAEGWDFTDVVPFFRKSENFAGGEGPWHGAGGPLQVGRARHYLGIVDSFLNGLGELGLPLADDLNAPADEAVGHYHWMARRGRRSSTARAFLRVARRRPNLKIMTDAKVGRIFVDKQRARAVEFSTGGPRRIAVAAREIILCAGAINTAKLLMLSGIGPADHLRAVGVTPVLDQPMVGENLRNHIAYKISYRCTSPITAYRYFRPLAGLAQLARYGVAGGGFLGQGASPAGGFYRSRADIDRADMQIFMVPLMLGDVGGGLRAMLPREHGVTFFVNQGRPESSGTVRLQSSDPSAPPLLDPRFLSDERDMTALIDGIARLDALESTPAFRAIGASLVNTERLTDRVAVEEQVRARADNHYHVCGTARMGQDRATSVVDPMLRVHGIAGLRIADASVMPTMLNANLAAPVIMIAERAAAFIAAEIQ